MEKTEQKQETNSFTFTSQDVRQSDDVTKCGGIFENLQMSNSLAFPPCFSSASNSYIFPPPPNSEHSFSTFPNYFNPRVQVHQPLSSFSPLSLKNIYVRQGKVSIINSYEKKKLSAVLETKKDIERPFSVSEMSSSHSNPPSTSFSSSPGFSPPTSDSSASASSSPRCGNPISHLDYSSLSLLSSETSFPLLVPSDFRNFQSNHHQHINQNIFPIDTGNSLQDNCNNRNIMFDHKSIAPYNNCNNISMNTENKNHVRNIQNSYSTICPYIYQKDLFYQLQMLIIREIQKMKSEIMQIQRSIISQHHVCTTLETKNLLNQINQLHERSSAIIIQNKMEIAAQADACKQSNKIDQTESADTTFDSSFLSNTIINILSNPFNKVLLVIGVGIGCYFLREHWAQSWKKAQLQRRIDSNILLRSVNILEQAIGGFSISKYFT